MISQNHLLCFSALLAWTLATVTGNYCVQRTPVDCEEYFDPLETGKREWRLAFRATPHIGQSAFKAYKDGTGVPSNSEPGCMQVDPLLPCSHHYRNNAILDTWNNINEVAVVLYKGGVRVQYVVFDAAGTSYMSWYTKDKIKHSSWTDLETETQNHFSIEGYVGPAVTRRFYINRNHGGCPEDAGWLDITDVGTSSPCGWENKGKLPVILYAAGTVYQNWSKGDIGQADIFAIFVKER